MKLVTSLDRVAAAASRYPAAMLVLLWIVAVIPWLAGVRTIPYDAKEEFYPGVVFTANSLLRGEAPFWNPYLYSGYPSFADPQAMTFSPSVVLPMLLSQDIAWFDVVVLLHVLCGGLGILALGKSYDWKANASFVAATVFMFGGVAASRLQHTPFIVTWAFLPWAFVSIRALFRTRSWRAVAGLGLALGLSLLQPTQVTYVFLLVIGAYAVYRCVCALLSEGMEPTLALGARLVAAAALALLIGSPQLVATLQVLPYSNRGRFDFASATANSLSPQAYLTLFSPDVLGNLSGSYVGPNDVTEAYLYLGAFPLALLLGGLAARAPAGRGEPWFWASALAFAVVYTLGSATPAFAWLHEYLPGVAYFRRPTDAAFLFVLCAAILVGTAFERLADDAAGAHGRARNLRALGVGAGLLLVVATVACAWHGTRPPLTSVALLGAGCYCFARMRAGPHAALWSAALVLSIFVDLRVHNVANHLNALRPGEYRANVSLAHNDTLRFLAQRLRAEGYYRIELRTRAGELNVPEIMGIASIAGLNPLVLRDYVAFVGLGTEPLLPRGASGVFASYRSRINDLLGVRYLVASDRVRPTIEGELGPAYRIVAEPKGRVIWENRNALPRVLRPRYAMPSPPVSAYTPAMLDSVDLEQSVYLEAPAEVLASCSGGRAEHAEIERYANNEVVVAVDTERRAWIVLNDVFLEGWRAEIAGTALPIYRANNVFRAVCVPPGRHSLRFVFEPFRHWSRQLWAAVGR